jgi:hypothetical protein
MARLGVAATNRASFYLYTIPEEIDRLVEGLHEVGKTLGNRASRTRRPQVSEGSGMTGRVERLPHPASGEMRGGATAF